MLFVRNIEHQSPYKGRKKLQKHIERYAFTKHIYKDKTILLRNLNKDDAYFMPDLAASVIKQLFLNGYYTHEQGGVSRLTEDALECCRDIIENIGFDNVFDRAFFDIIHQGDAEQCVMIIARCQNASILKRRVKKAVAIAKQISCELNVIFSGENPSIKGLDEIEIFSEAVRMEMYFKEYWQADATQANIPPSVHFIVERNSDNTQANIQNSIQGNLVDLKKKTNLIIVSSTFHLIRLAQDFERTLQTTDTQIKNVLLAGAEEATYPLKPNDDDATYVKSMFADILHYLFG